MPDYYNMIGALAGAGVALAALFIACDAVRNSERRRCAHIVRDCENNPCQGWRYTDRERFAKMIESGK